ncbi:hypothetical protein F5890DRAFT_1487947 [Lentinula detonsa]|uniref:Uncharacterized protein n=1 Tax=Lentinula detonsa TaxID=2804962 RepID=A0AA38Q7P9_9AGAR|nr:hypothetical protein F5890DRAFT_1487947 [Lentinula detonsa]
MHSIFFALIVASFPFLLPTVLVAEVDALPVSSLDMSIKTMFTPNIEDRGIPSRIRTEIGYSYHAQNSLDQECETYEEKKPFNVDIYTRMSPVPNYDSGLGSPPGEDWCECVFDANENMLLHLSKLSKLVYEPDDKKITALKKSDSIFFSDVQEGKVPEMIIFEDTFKNRDFDIQVQCHAGRTAKKTISFHEWGVKNWPKRDGMPTPVEPLHVQTNSS